MAKEPKRPFWLLRQLPDYLLVLRKCATLSDARNERRLYGRAFKTRIVRVA